MRKNHRAHAEGTVVRSVRAQFAQTNRAFFFALSPPTTRKKNVCVMFYTYVLQQTHAGPAHGQ